MPPARTLVGPMFATMAFVLMACAHNPARSNRSGMDYESLLAALGAGGARVESGGPIEQPFFSVKGRFARINGEDVQVFEYSDAEAARAEAARVSPDGGTIGTARPFWAAPPHFYRRDRLISLYVGESTSVQAVLASVLGPQFAGR